MRLKGTAYYIIIGFFCLYICDIHGQNQNMSDSLTNVYHKGVLEGTEKLQLLRDLSFNEVNDVELSLKYAEELISLAALHENDEFLSSGYLRQGNAHRLLGNLEQALKSFFRGAEIAKKAKNLATQGAIFAAIADVYSIMDNSDNSMNYYGKSIALFRRIKDSVPLASALTNAGDEYFNSSNYDSAMAYFEEAGIIFEKINYLNGTAYNLGNVGMVYAEQGKDVLAETNINEAITILEEIEDYYPISVYLTYMSDIYSGKNDLKKALTYAEKSLELATNHGLKDQISEANLKLSELYEQSGDLATSYKHYKEHIIYRDSVKNIEAVQQMANQRTNYEVAQKQIEVDLADQRRKNQRNISIATAVALFLIVLMAVGLYRRNKFIRKTKQIIEQEKERSDSLLLNILPEETALELKEKGKVKAKKYDAVTVLFSDFKDFTSYSEKLSPEALVETVDFYFSKFDAIIEKHGLEKIKTIGDAYMCAGGLHDNEKDHASRMVLAAMEIAAFVEDTKNDMAASELTFDIRIGINTGPVVAGVVGTRKFAYDIWGDTVNVAARMESNSEAGKINISENTYDLIKDSYNCAFRGEIKVKNRGSLKMYFVEGQKTSIPV